MVHVEVFFACTEGVVWACAWSRARALASVGSALFAPVTLPATLGSMIYGAIPPELLAYVI